VHVFICYLSYLLLSLLQIKLRKTVFSPIAALKELDTLYFVPVQVIRTLDNSESAISRNEGMGNVWIIMTRLIKSMEGC
jgi:hypothetical protein